MAVFAATPAPQLPTKDILSWIFDKPDYDVNKPVCHTLFEWESTETTICVN